MKVGLWLHAKVSLDKILTSEIPQISIQLWNVLDKQAQSIEATTDNLQDLNDLLLKYCNVSSGVQWSPQQVRAFL